MRQAAFFVVASFGALLTADYSLLGGRLTFAAPNEWREAGRHMSGDSGSFVAFVVPRPGNDSPGPLGNVLVDAAFSQRRWNLKTYSDAKVNQDPPGPGRRVVVEDRVWEDDQSRTVLSTRQLRGTAYAVWDKFAVRDSIYLQIRTAIPVAYANDSAWQARYETALDSLIHSFQIGGRPVFVRAR